MIEGEGNAPLPAPSQSNPVTPLIAAISQATKLGHYTQEAPLLQSAGYLALKEKMNKQRGAITQEILRRKLSVKRAWQGLGNQYLEEQGDTTWRKIPLRALARPAQVGYLPVHLQDLIPPD